LNGNQNIEVDKLFTQHISHLFQGLFTKFSHVFYTLIYWYIL